MLIIALQPIRSIDLSVKFNDSYTRNPLGIKLRIFAKLRSFNFGFHRDHLSPLMCI